MMDLLSPKIIFLMYIGGLKDISLVCFRLSFDHQMMQYNNSSELIKMTKMSSYVSGLAVDWVHERIYFCEGGSIMEFDLLSGNSRRLPVAFTLISYCSDVVMDPYNR